MFGVVKKKMNQMSRPQKMDFATNAELYEASFRQMKETMEGLSDKIIKKAWDMPLLRKYLAEKMEPVDDLNDPDYQDQDDD